MKKVIRFIILGIFVILCMCAFSKKAEATTVDLDYSVPNESEENTVTKINAGDEILVSVTINGEENGKMMAIFGTLEYDENVLELEKEDNSENSAKIELGKGWTIGDLSMKGSTEENAEESSDENSDQESPKFLIYSSDENRENTAVYIRFKVKSDVDTKKLKTTEVTVKDITLYDSEHKETDEEVGEVTLKIDFTKVGKLSKADKIVAIVAVIVIILIMIIIIIGITLNKKQEKISKTVLKNENGEISIKTSNATDVKDSNEKEKAVIEEKPIEKKDKEEIKENQEKTEVQEDSSTENKENEVQEDNSIESKETEVQENSSNENKEIETQENNSNGNEVQDNENK